jgi:hypothetical protein
MTDRIEIDGTGQTPALRFDFENMDFFLEGESYPEDVGEFYGPVMTPWLERIEQAAGADIRFEIRLRYFNSSSARVLLNIFDALDESAKQGNTVTIVWSYAEDDDNMEEFGEEFAEDIEAAKFVLQSY